MPRANKYFAYFLFAIFFLAIGVYPQIDTFLDNYHNSLDDFNAIMDDDDFDLRHDHHSTKIDLFSGVITQQILLPIILMCSLVGTAFRPYHSKTFKGFSSSVSGLSPPLQ